MSIGYACIALGVEQANLRSCIAKNVTEDKLHELISHNLKSLETIIDYNIRNHIQLFRISSDLIPFGSSPLNQLHWWNVYSTKFQRIGDKINEAGMRVSMHPGQYTVLNSPDEGIVERAILDLNYHALVLDSLRVGPEHKLILHIGGIYKDKENAISRFSRNYKSLSQTVKDRLVIENDDKNYNIMDVLTIGKKEGIPVVFDNLHNKVNQVTNISELKYIIPNLSKGSNNIKYDELENIWIDECNKTWTKRDGVQKIHYSQQDPNKRAGSHSETINTIEFKAFYHSLANKNIDIMLEVKDKNISALKCIHMLKEEGGIDS